MCHVVFIGGTTNISDMTIFPAKFKKKKKSPILEYDTRCFVLCMTVVTDGSYDHIYSNN